MYLPYYVAYISSPFHYFLQKMSILVRCEENFFSFFKKERRYTKFINLDKSRQILFFNKRKIFHFTLLNFFYLLYHLILFSHVSRSPNVTCFPYTCIICTSILTFAFYQSLVHKCIICRIGSAIGS